MSRTKFTFHRDYIGACEMIENPESQLNFLKALIGYGLDNIEPNLDPVGMMAFNLLKHKLDRGSINALNGVKGGRPKKDTDDVDVYRSFKHLTLTNDEFEKLRENYPKDKIDSVLDDIENYRDNKKYVNLYLTARKWLTNDFSGKANYKGKKGGSFDVMDFGM